MTTTPSQLAAAIAEGQQRRAAQKAEYEQLADERAQRQKQEIADKWAPILIQISDELPEWARPFLVAGTTGPEFFSDHCWHIRCATISLPDLAPIFAYAWRDTVGFEAARFGVVQDADIEDELASTVEITNGYARTIYEEAGTGDFLIALAEAAENYQLVPELEAEAQRRNDSMKKRPAATPPVDHLTRAKGNLNDLEMSDTSRAIAHALIAICERLDSVIAPLRSGERAINTFDTSRPL